MTTPLSARLEAARDALSAERGHRVSNRHIAEEAGVSPPTVDRMMRGVGRPSLQNVESVAAVLKVPLAEARRLAGYPAKVGGPYRPPEESRLLTIRQRKALDELIKSVVESSLDEAEPGPTVVAELSDVAIGSLEPEVDHRDHGT